jgi:hypothetical protein
LNDNRAVYVKAIRDRLRQLDSRPEYRTTPAEYEMLVAAAHVAQQRDVELAAFEAVCDAVRQQADSLYRGQTGMRPVFLCAYWNRVKPADAVPCGIEQSLLHTEWKHRQVSRALAAPADRSRASAIANALTSIAADVCALTDFGVSPPPASDLFADTTFWSQLCEGGIRWGMAGGDRIVVARIVFVASCVGVEAEVPSWPAALAWLMQQQEPDGTFGITAPTSANPYRDGVLAAILALGASL